MAREGKLDPVIGREKEIERVIQILVRRRKNNPVLLGDPGVGKTAIVAGSAEGSIDASNMLKPALARGEIQVIGATTLDEYRKYIEKDGALERRFQPVIVDPPSEEDTIQILYGLKKKFEDFHGVEYTPEAIEKAVSLSVKYITDRNLPDKAIDVLDEAGALVKLKSINLPPELKELEEKIKELEREKNEAAQVHDFERAGSMKAIWKNCFILKKNSRSVL